MNCPGRCSIVDYWGHVVLDIYSIPDEKITDFRTQWSGIQSHHMTHAIPFDSARNVTKSILKVNYLHSAIFLESIVYNPGHFLTLESD